MNLLLLRPSDVSPSGLATLTKTNDPLRFKHIQETLNVDAGQTIAVGIENGLIGRAQVLMVNQDEIELKCDCQQAPPAPLPLTLIIALPRPKMLKRIIQTIATMGVKKVVFIHSWKVEKSYWQSPWLQPNKIYENLVLGLEQARDTHVPSIHLKKLFKPFVEDELFDLSEGSRRLIAHPGETVRCPVDIKEPVTMVIGPEGGFTPYEVEKLKEQGFEGVSLGERIMRVETAVTHVISRLYCE